MGGHAIYLVALRRWLWSDEYAMLKSSWEVNIRDQVIPIFSLFKATESHFSTGNVLLWVL